MLNFSKNWAHANKECLQRGPLRPWIIWLYTEYICGEKRYWKWTQCVEHRPVSTFLTILWHLPTAKGHRSVTLHSGEQMMPFNQGPGFLVSRNHYVLFLGLRKNPERKANTGKSRVNITLNLNLTKIVEGIQVIRSILKVAAGFKHLWPHYSTVFQQAPPHAYTKALLDKGKCQIWAWVLSPSQKTAIGTPFSGALLCCHFVHFWMYRLHIVGTEIFIFVLQAVGLLSW